MQLSDSPHRLPGPEVLTSGCPCLGESPPTPPPTPEPSGPFESLNFSIETVITRVVEREDGVPLQTTVSQWALEVGTLRQVRILAFA